MAAKVIGIVSKKETNRPGEEEVNSHAPIIINLNSPPLPETANKIEKIDINLNSPPPPETTKNKGKAPADEPPVVPPPLSHRLSSLHPLTLGPNMEHNTQAQSQPQPQPQAQPKGETKTQTQTQTQAQTKGTTTVRQQGFLDLCRRTAAEVWIEVYKKNPHLIRGTRPTDKPGPAQKLPMLLPRPARNPSPAENQPNPGDMTLENFLAHAGVVPENPPQPPASGPPQPRPRAYVNQSIGQPSGVAPPPPERRSVATGGALPAHGGCPQPGEGIGVSVAAAGANPTGTVNRESAARSRARKQAYTEALEGELKKVQGELQELRDENTRLRQNLVNLHKTELENKRKRKSYGEAARARPKLLDEKFKELRRTSSSFV